MIKLMKIFLLALVMLSPLISNAKNISDFEEEISKLNFKEQKKIFNKYMNGSGNEKSIYPLLGYMYYNGYGVSKNTNAAINIYQRLVADDSKVGYYLLGRHYIETNTDISKGLSYLISASDANLVEAALFIGKIYKEGIGVSKDDYYSTEYYYKAAKMGSTEAKFIIAQDLVNSIEVAKIKKGLVLLTEAADNKNSDACRQLKDLYITKNNILKQDANKHFNYLLCLADNGDLESIRTVAEYYSKGIIVMIDNKSAYDYYKKYIIKVTDPKTEEDKDVYYKSAISSIKLKKYSEAVALLKIISAKEHSAASNILGRLYEDDFLGRPNLKLSLKYYELSKEQGFENDNDISRVKKNLLEKEKNK